MEITVPGKPTRESYTVGGTGHTAGCEIVYMLRPAARHDLARALRDSGHRPDLPGTMYDDPLAQHALGCLCVTRIVSVTTPDGAAVTFREGKRTVAATDPEVRLLILDAFEGFSTAAGELAYRRLQELHGEQGNSSGEPASEPSDPL